MQVGYLKFWVLGGMEVLFRHHDSLLEELFIDGNAGLLRHQHPAKNIIEP